MQKKTSEERMTTLIQTLDNIVKYEYVDETDSSPISDNVKQYWEHLCGVYEDPEFRHSYSMLSSQFQEYDPEQRDSLKVYLDRIVLFSEMQTEPEDIHRITKALTKLLDHVELECIRLNRMSQIEYLADEARSAQEQSQILNKQTEEAVGKLNDRVTDFHGQSITILGIFSAVVIGFMAEISMFTSGFDKLSYENLYTITFYSIAVGIIIFDTLFMLICFIAKMSGHSIDRKIKKGKWWITSTWYRYPGVYCFNILAIISLAMLLYLDRR